MSGHNKWSKIKRKKGVSDARRSKVFTKILREIAIAVKESGADTHNNPRLRLAMDNAHGVNMPKDTIQRAIDKASGKDATAYIETTYEGYGPHGIAIYAECTTDNIKRTVSDIRHTFSKYGGELGMKGSLDFLFEQKGIFLCKKGNFTQDDFTMQVIDAGAEEIEDEDDTFTVITHKEDFGKMHKKLEEMKVEVISAGLQMIPKTTTALSPADAQLVCHLIEELEENDDVQNVYSNLE